jgi:hypothetical protein
MATSISMSTKDNERLQHGLHNEKVCEYIDLKQDFADWTITTAFYSALQFVKYKIFPFKMPAIEGKETNIEDLDDYILYQRNNTSNKVDRHQVLADLVEKHCPVISEDYNWLLDMSKNARYSNYQHPKEIANKSKRLMRVIKKHCVPV